MLSKVKRLVVAAIVAGSLAAGAATPAAAQTQTQTGLVNVAIGDVVIQVPVAIAANICDLNVGVLVGDFRDDGEAKCTAVSGSEATITPAQPGGGPNQTQTGLVNVAIGDVTVQVPISAALNLCDVNLAVLVGQFEDTGTAECEAEAGSEAGA
jgi:hypothetical protein